MSSHSPSGPSFYSIYPIHQRFAYATLSPDLHFSWASPELLKLLDRKSESLEGAHLIDILDEFTGMEEVLGTVLRGQRNCVSLENLNYGIDNEESRYITFSVFPMEKDQPQKGLLLLIEDVTQAGRLRQQLIQDRNELRLTRLELERVNQIVEKALIEAQHEIAERKRVETALRASQELLAKALEIAHMAVWELDFTTQTINLNDQWYQLLDTNAEHEGGYQLSLERFVQEFVHPDDATSLQASFQDAARSHILDYGNSLSYRLIDRGGKVRFADAKFRVESDADGEPIRAVGYSLDMTERQQTREALDRRSRELEFALRELESFSYSISHDLRTPLRALNGYSQILLEDYAGVVDDDGRQIIQNIQVSAINMNNMVEGLLDYSRIGRQALNRQLIQPTLIVELVIEELRPTVQNRAIEFITNKLPACSADGGLLRIVFHNLISNAVKFTRLSDPARIEVDWVENNGKNIYLVRDNGVGFDMRLVGRLFGIFQRLHSQDEYEGIGASLAITHRIITRHGGRIWAEAAPGHGATFFFNLE